MGVGSGFSLRQNPSVEPKNLDVDPLYAAFWQTAGLKAAAVGISLCSSNLMHNLQST